MDEIPCPNLHISQAFGF
ncbi:hypothetical protein F383_18660 [Gossypium arboreum]|uniref:Uncharacterized protein n=1 Tax=Gossypium arboreum TaxID=29729 RepID=A0A0B0MG14_GOSAR|nr:hypothetical protein F383_18660 [Gossypium arboreum]